MTVFIACLLSCSTLETKHQPTQLGNCLPTLSKSHRNATCLTRSETIQSYPYRVAHLVHILQSVNTIVVAQCKSQLHVVRRYSSHNDTLANHGGEHHRTKLELSCVLDVGHKSSHCNERRSAMIGMGTRRGNYYEIIQSISLPSCESLWLFCLRQSCIIQHCLKPQLLLKTAHTPDLSVASLDSRLYKRKTAGHSNILMKGYLYIYLFEIYF